MGADTSEPRSTILRLHGEEEKTIEDSGIPYTFLRPPTFMQNFVTQFGHTINKMHFMFLQEMQKRVLCILTILSQAYKIRKISGWL
jgi:NmrA-like family